jgi:uncharacterized membrane protein YphA (DoxX/SURF4 family)
VVARPLLASIFVVQGYETLRHPEQVVSRAEPVVRPLAERIGPVPDDPLQAVRINGAVQMVAGSLLALGWLPRLSALAIAATLVPTTAAGHRFWEAEDEQERKQQRIHFLKNASMLGGLLIAAADTGGRPSIAWRSQHAARAGRRSLKRTARTARVAGKAAKVSAKAGKMSAKAGNVSAKAGKVPAKARTMSARAGKVPGKAGALAGRVASRLPVG